MESLKDRDSQISFATMELARDVKILEEGALKSEIDAIDAQIHEMALRLERLDRGLPEEVGENKRD